ncbi:Hypothetical protein A7982_05275 [Minicystis rosea]|nr:Hypothetical protein A7982_05275 [Minicystis rosea]
MSSTGTAGQPESINDWKLFNVGDVNDDNLADVHWWSRSRNQLALWLMNGTHVLAPGRPIPGPPGEGWIAVSSADFNRDGFSDVIWTNEKRGSAAIWLLRGARLLAPGPEIPGPPGEGWLVGNANDTNGDGLGDIVWHNAQKQRAAVWLMNGARLLARGPELPAPPGTGWLETNVADTNGDGLSDVLWETPDSNTLQVWLMNGAHILAAGPSIPGPPGEGWTAITSADFNRDGMSDVIWTNAKRGTMAVWLMSGAHLLAAGPEIPGPSGEGWAIAYAGDTNGDGMADAVWQKEGTSQFAVWLMNGAKLLAAGPVLAGPGELEP